jgi:hypothetical protein
MHPQRDSQEEAKVAAGEAKELVLAALAALQQELLLAKDSAKATAGWAARPVVVPAVVMAISIATDSLILSQRRIRPLLLLNRSRPLKKSPRVHLPQRRQPRRLIELLLHDLRLLHPPSIARTMKRTALRLPINSSSKCSRPPVRFVQDRSPSRMESPLTKHSA